MKCPFTFGNPASDADEECRSDCALCMKAVFYDVEKNRIVETDVCALAASACNMESVRFVPQCGGAAKVDALENFRSAQRYVSDAAARIARIAWDCTNGSSE